MHAYIQPGRQTIDRSCSRLWGMGGVGGGGEGGISELPIAANAISRNSEEDMQGFM